MTDKKALREFSVRTGLLTSYLRGVALEVETQGVSRQEMLNPSFRAGIITGIIYQATESIEDNDTAKAFADTIFPTVAALVDAALEEVLS